MLKMLNMALIQCPVGFSEENIAVFQMKKSQIDTESDKNFDMFQFSKISCIFSKFLADFVEWNVEKGQQGGTMLSTGLFRRAYCSFFSENVLN